MLSPRLDLRQSQSLVMTPQLRQAIKLLQSSNLEVMAFVEEELARNPLLEPEEGHAAAPAEPPPPADAAEAARSDMLAEPPLDADYANVVDEGEAYRPSLGSGGRADFADDLSGIEEMPAAGPTLRERLAEQIRLAFAAPRERMIAAALLALVEPSGRLALDSASLAARLGALPEEVERI
ncbi:MAG: RNA polymerase sigma-54 factor, partial [Roseococcus sp.]